jgi:2-iminobutanoate/2-iminopropanoate deaminase
MYLCREDIPCFMAHESFVCICQEHAMKVQRIVTQPDPYEPFRLAQGYRVGDLLFISGQAATGDDGKIVGKGDFDAQARQNFANLDRALRAGGSSLGNIVKVTIFLTDMSRFDKIVELRGRYFSPPYPADTIVQVSALYSPDAMIEIEAVAIADDAVEKS